MGGYHESQVWDGRRGTSWVGKSRPFTFEVVGVKIESSYVDAKSNRLREVPIPPEYYHRGKSGELTNFPFFLLFGCFSASLLRLKDHPLHPRLHTSFSARLSLLQPPFLMTRQVGAS